MGLNHHLAPRQAPLVDLLEFLHLVLAPQLLPHHFQPAGMVPLSLRQVQSSAKAQPHRPHRQLKNLQVVTPETFSFHFITHTTLARFMMSTRFLRNMQGKNSNSFLTWPKSTTWTHRCLVSMQYSRELPLQELQHLGRLPPLQQELQHLGQLAPLQQELQHLGQPPRWGWVTGTALDLVDPVAPLVHL